MTHREPLPEVAETKERVPANAFYLPSPVVLLSTIGRDSTPDVSAMSAAGALCLTPAVIGIGIKPSRRSYRNIRETGDFVVNLPLQEHLHAVDFTGTRKLRHHPAKIGEAGLTLGAVEGVRSPCVLECPIVMACELVGTLGPRELGLPKASHQVVLGKIVSCFVDAEWIRDDEVAIEQMPLLLYLNRIYAAVGENLAVQRFTDDEQKRLVKMREYRSLSYAEQEAERGSS